MKILATAGFFFVLGFIGCGDTHTSYSYEFTVSGCDTGEQKFTTLDEMCLALQSDAVNNSCALSSREAFFTKNNCPGTFQETT